MNSYIDNCKDTPSVHVMLSQESGHRAFHYTQHSHKDRPSILCVEVCGHMEFQCVLDYIRIYNLSCMYGEYVDTWHFIACKTGIRKHHLTCMSGEYVDTWYFSVYRTIVRMHHISYIRKL